MVAFADAQFVQSEEGRFLSTIANDPALSSISARDLEASYNDLVAAFSENYSDTAKTVIEAIANIKDDPAICEAVKMSARRAIVADEVIMAQEETVLDQISLALGLEKGSI